MLRSLVVGLGRAGSDLHPRVLSQARAVEGELFDPRPIVGYDSASVTPNARHEMTAVDSVHRAAELMDPARTVAHVCTPPDRLAIVEELASRGFRRLIVEKPLATGIDELRQLRVLRGRYGLDLAVVAHWLEAELTERLIGLVRRADLGELRSITFTQHKPRFNRTIATSGHPTAFDVEIPHSLGVVLRLAGAARLVDAECTDMHSSDGPHPLMGSARMKLRHTTGVRSEIYSDLTAPVRQRRIELVFAHGRVIGHYPLGEDDEHAQLVLGDRRQVFRDDALTRFMLRAYRHFHEPTGTDHGTFEPHCDVVRLISEAKAHCSTRTVPMGRNLENAR